ncbi:pyridoxal phosphate-dependent aminotransferase [Phocaeicola barnesiae]|jgi:aspartate/methionine/tyrosine aminotransferase|uniref:aminotransferase class I/II-fold pyridoxal phosphate-dependent enzyme n=1 Tax=Phocaeicola barnesiae TaxID=376804 RepID=UPI00033C15F0|nr:pyridoxal phosphate-dependent aminotransferase [Phocaeicola barnesiae]MBS6468354.1 pyridoxal phosphate-dependent aminotransferase [Bacteroides sp.]CDD33846.1 aminotransferase class I/II [Bacteroides sp. CAG:714]MCF2575078.1 pyridoxal phosphate-dependent aminotransferase [Phocaeicola barnesiae]MCF2598808.1 pyridoxal phosphate-dependent aminotransferase [Phocaeicola barnesiae]MDM8233801.1 pyridoxal phosphate-dependent aminotransferase [Phocaeicola barnesiae]
MKHQVFSEELVAQVVDELKVANLEQATIGEVLLVASRLEELTGIPFIRMDQGSPGLPANRIGIEAEKAALDRGVGSQYPAAAGVAELKAAASRFVKAFVDIDISPAACVPTTGSVASSFGAFIACTQRIPGKDKVLFIDPGFPIQKSQLRIIGVKWEWFDIYHYRGEALRAKMEEYLSKGDIAAIVYSNPNNPAWICLEDSELKIIGELATRYDAVVMEDMAYFCMDFRRDMGKPYEPPYPPTVAKYTDNYVLMLSSSKIFSYAGQRMAVICISDRLFNTYYPALAERYGDSGIFGQTLIASILYMITSGCTASTQYAYAAMLDAAVEGRIDFVADTREYARRAERMKKIFTDNGFHIVYDYDVTQPVGDGFFFTLGYGKLSSGQLLKELLYYGVSSIALGTTGSEQQGVRACTSRMREELYPVMEERMKAFRMDHPLD